MENEHGRDEQSTKAEKGQEKAEEKKPPQVTPEGGTSSPPGPPK